MGNSQEDNQYTFKEFLVGLILLILASYGFWKILERFYEILKPMF